jgi:hypothetical protein
MKKGSNTEIKEKDMGRIPLGKNKGKSEFSDIFQLTFGKLKVILSRLYF